MSKITVIEGVSSEANLQKALELVGENTIIKCKLKQLENTLLFMSRNPFVIVQDLKNEEVNEAIEIYENLSVHESTGKYRGTATVVKPHLIICCTELHYLASQGTIDRINLS